MLVDGPLDWAEVEGAVHARAEGLEHAAVDIGSVRKLVNILRGNVGGFDGLEVHRTLGESRQNGYLETLQKKR